MGLVLNIDHIPVLQAGQYLLHTSLVVFLMWTLASICHQTYLRTSKSHVTKIIKKVNKIPIHCGVAYESVAPSPT